MEPTVKRYTLPKGCPARSVDVRELLGVHDLEATRMADALGAGQKLTARDVVNAERREAIRLSIVRLDDRVIDHVVPLMEIDGWSRAARAALGRYFDDVNGVNLAEVKRLISEAEVLTDGKGRNGKRYTLPPGCSVATVDLWEIGGHEELAAGLAADAAVKAGPGERALLHRRALVAGAMREAGKVADWDGWTLRTVTAISLYFEDVNGIPSDEIEGFVAGAVVVSGAAPAQGNQPPTAPEVAGATG